MDFGGRHRATSTARHDREEPWLATRINQIYDLIETALNNVSLITIYSFLIFSTSIFIYISLYNIYVPIVQHTKPIYLQFDSACQHNCSYPYALVGFNDIRSSFPLARGQSYRFIIGLDMPESDINWNQGMFMIRLRLIESQGKTLYDDSRPAIMKYKTLVTRLLQALCYWPLLVTRYKNEMQTLNIQLIDNYIEGAKFNFNKMDRAIVELIARDIQIYSAHLRIEANLRGLSYYMYYWSVTSSIVGIATISAFISLISVYRTTQTGGFVHYQNSRDGQEYEEDRVSSSGQDEEDEHSIGDGGELTDAVHPDYISGGHWEEKQ